MYFFDFYLDENDVVFNVFISYNWGDDFIKIMVIWNYESYQIIYLSNSLDFVLKKVYQFGLEGFVEDSLIVVVLDFICEDNFVFVIW